MLTFYFIILQKNQKKSGFVLYIGNLTNLKTHSSPKL